MINEHSSCEGDNRIFETEEYPYPGDDSDYPVDDEDQNMWDEDLANNGWPGDGTGEDDFADYNQNEANDYLEKDDQRTEKVNIDEFFILHPLCYIDIE